jgi:hypothetical protein
MPEPPRRVVIGLDADNRSTVVRVDSRLPGGLRPSGSTVHELWRQEQIPARLNDAERSPDAVNETRLSDTGVSIRRLVIPPDPQSATESAFMEADVLGSENGPARGGRELHPTECLYVGTVSTGAVYLLLEAGEVLLSQADTFVLPDSMHAWYNPFDTAAVIVATTFPLLSD